MNLSEEIRNCAKLYGNARKDELLRWAGRVLGMETELQAAMRASADDRKLIASLLRERDEARAKARKEKL